MHLLLAWQDLAGVPAGGGGSGGETGSGHGGWAGWLGGCAAGWRGGWVVRRARKGREAQHGTRLCLRMRGRWDMCDQLLKSWRAATALLLFVLFAPSAELVVLSCVVY